MDQTLNITGLVLQLVLMMVIGRLRPLSYGFGRYSFLKSPLNSWKANIYVGSISKLNQEDMRYDMDVFFRQFWNDPRLNLATFTNKITTGKVSFQNGSFMMTHHAFKSMKNLSIRFGFLICSLPMVSDLLVTTWSEEMHYSGCRQRAISHYQSASRWAWIVKWILKCFLSILRPVHYCLNHMPTANQGRDSWTR